MNQSAKERLGEVLSEGPILGVAVVDVAIQETLKSWQDKLAGDDPKLFAVEEFFNEVTELAEVLISEVCDKLEIE